MQCLLGKRPCGRFLPTTSRRSHELRCSGRLICPNVAYGTFYTAGETPRAPRAPSLVVICDLVLMQCLLGRRPCGRLLPTTSRRSHELRCLNRLICPNAACGAFYTAGETPRAPRAPSLVVICDLVLMQCLLGRRPCGRLLPSTTWRSQSLPTTSRRLYYDTRLYIMIHVLIALGSRVSLTMLARIGAGKVGTLGAWSTGPQGVSSTLPSFKRPEWILEPRARI